MVNIKLKGIFSLLGVIIVLAIVGVSAMLFMALAGEKIEKEKLQNELASVMKERNKLSNEIEELKVIKSDLEIKIGELEAQTRLFAENYEREKSQNEGVKTELIKRQAEVNEIRDKLDIAIKDKLRLQEQREEDKEKYTQLKERVDKLIEVKDALEEKVREVIDKQGIKLERIVVKAEGELEGKVVVVNRDFNFIVVDIGVRDEIAIGDALMVFRGGKFLGEANIEKIYDTMSAATIIKEASLNAIQVGDTVVMRSQ